MLLKIVGSQFIVYGKARSIDRSQSVKGRCSLVSVAINGINMQICLFPVVMMMFICTQKTSLLEVLVLRMKHEKNDKYPRNDKVRKKNIIKMKT